MSHICVVIEKYRFVVAHVSWIAVWRRTRHSTSVAVAVLVTNSSNPLNLEEVEDSKSFQIIPHNCCLVSVPLKIKIQNLAISLEISKIL